MKLFSCSECGQTIFFENVRCERCGATLAYLPDAGVMSAMKESGDWLVASAREANGRKYRLCANSIEHGVCNWVVPVEDDNDYCSGCRLNAVVPNLSHPGALESWGYIERAKKRLLYTLYELGLPVESQRQKKGGLVFSFLESEPASPVLTGHDDGHITLNVAEADTPFREKLREELGEAYRTLLGHFRHEIGHYYWDVLIRDGKWLADFRSLFGDETKDYNAELQRHYREGPPPGWPSAFVSSYATMHPWEDWAETWAHYLHIVDTLGTARSYGIAIRPELAGGGRPPSSLNVNVRRLDFDDFDDLMTGWFPLTFALNSLNRGMGLSDLYPFILSERAIAKLRFVHDVIEHADVRVNPALPATQPVNLPAPGTQSATPSAPQPTNKSASASRA
ncbi:MAG TPA: putative zinc-binding metallopeptidase [Polyangiaceae bacterium]|jgi:hypothetical protein|nr:putative zinc-binding metallopeptidase [Polyangiaceae bacterium]